MHPITVNARSIVRAKLEESTANMWTVAPELVLGWIISGGLTSPTPDDIRAGLDEYKAWTAERLRRAG